MDLAQFDNYSTEIKQAIKGDRAPLVAKLRAGVEPTKLDLRCLADLLEKRPAHRPKTVRKASATQRLADAGDIRSIAGELYRKTMAELKARGEARGAQERVNAEVCKKFGLDPAQFTTWRKQRRTSVKNSHSS